MLSECQIVCIQIRTDVLLVLNWVQNYLQMLSADKERVGNLGNNEYKRG